MSASATIAVADRSGQLPRRQRNLKRSLPFFQEIVRRGELTRMPLQESGPQLSLLAPIRYSGDRLHVGQVNRIATVLGRGQEQNLLLNVRSQKQQVRDLRDAGAGH